MSPAEFVAACRSLTKKSQTEFAEKLGVHKQTVSDYERGKVTPLIEALREIASIAGMDFDKQCLSIPVGPPKESDEKRVLRLFRSLTGQRRRHAIELLSDLAQLQQQMRKSD